MEIRIAYFIAATLIAAAFFLFYIVVKPSPQPDMKLTGRLSDDEIKKALTELAAKKHNEKSVDLSLRNVCRIIRKAYKKISAKENKAEYEKWIFDNYYKIEEHMRELKKTSFSHLTGMDGLPRTYVIASTIVKGSCGAVSPERICEFVAEFNKICPLRFSELTAFKSALSAALIEYVAAFAAKSLVITDKVRAGETDSVTGEINLSNFSLLSYTYGYMSTGKNGKAFRDLCAKNGVSASDRCDTFATLIAKYASNVSSAIKSLNVKLDDSDLLDLSALNSYLTKNAQGYADCTIETKLYYLNSITRNKGGEIEYAQKIVEKATTQNKDIGNFILPQKAGIFLQIVYFLVVFAATVGNCITVYSLAPSLKILFAILFVPVSLGLSLSFVYAINARLVERRFLPSSKLSGDEKTLIVFPVLIGSVEAVKKAIYNLKTVAAANRNKIFSYGLLIDLPKSADGEYSGTDKAIIKELKEQFAGLSDKYLLLIRKRTFIKEDNCYYGWEKKRGAIIELNNFILSEDNSAFRTVRGKMHNFEYVITLDEDTMLNCAEQLVRIMKHPYNADKAVIALKMKSDPSSLVTPFATLMNDAKGLSSYSSFAADVNYDLFDCGNYTGKGIYRVREFNSSVGSIPEGRILSHDFIEGAMSGCANSDLEAVDEFPHSFAAFLSRNVRWLRGDYQLLPCLFWKNEKFVSPHVAKFHILTNIVLGLIPVSSFAFALASLFFTEKTLLFVLAAFASEAFVLLGALSLVFKNPQYVIKETLRRMYLCACLPITSVAYFCAITITLIRLVRKKKLLEWKTAAMDETKTDILPCVISAMIFLTAFCVKTEAAYLIFSVVFAVGAALPGLTSIRRRSKTVEDEDKLLRIAKKTWSFFESFLVDEYNYLPCDNLQDGIAAKRTSPTNVSFMLTSVYCAEKLKFIDKDVARNYYDKIIESVEKLPKWKGNCYNWVDVTTLKPLSSFVSSVDSGNLLAALLLVGGSVSGSLAHRISKLVDETEIEAFYDERTHLLAIGYDEKSGFTEGKYDLLGSEAMLTYLVGYGLGKLPIESFYALSRRCVKYKGSSLYSWTGGVFEYMMSSIYFDYVSGSFLNQSAKSVMRAHIANKIEGAWGMSESQYLHTDQNGFYDYKAFGVEQIALSREINRKVLTPYASILFLPYFPSAVEKNIYALEKLRLIGKYGFYEAYDGSPVRTFMAHHQGMVMASITNALTEKTISKDFASPAMRAAALNLTFSESPQGERKTRYAARKIVSTDYVAVKTFPKKLNIMSNGEYSVIVDSDGYGYSRYKDNQISRRYDYMGGFNVFVGSGKHRVAGKCVIGDGVTKFYDTADGFSVERASVVLPINGEAHRITITNTTNETRETEVYGFMEAALCRLYDDISHKTFSGMFVKRAYDSEFNASIAYRNGLYAAIGADKDVTFVDTRAEFYGRADGGFDPVLCAKAKIKLLPKQSEVINFVIVVAENTEALKRLLKTAKGYAYVDGAFCGASTLSGAFGVCEKMRFAASQLIYNGVPSTVSELPTVYIDCDNISAAVTNKLKMLQNLRKAGVEFCVAAASSEDGYRIGEINGYGLNIVQVRKNDKTALNSCTNIDDVIYVTMPQRSFTNGSLGNAPSMRKAVEYKLGYGGYVDDGNAYYMELDKLPPRPWSNIIADKNFGTIITEKGGGYTFYRNSRQSKLTDWSNDPVADPLSEGVFFLEDGDLFSVTKSVVKDAEYTAEHGLGYSEFTCNYALMQSVQTEFISGCVKYYLIRLKSFSPKKRTLNAVFFAKPVLGDFVFKTRHNLTAEFSDVLTVTNALSGAEMVMGCSLPLSLYDEIKSYSSGEYVAVSTRVQIEANGETEFYFYLSAGDRAEADVKKALLCQKRKYSHLSDVEISTGDKSLDYLAKWLPYQTYTSRFYGRTGFYQAGGAIGFRDQLQDCLTMLYVNPGAVRSHIITAAAHQFESGDVMHWWHPPMTGVRTKICDDRLFLPLVTAEYIAYTGDKSILSERVPYVKNVRIIGKDVYGEMESTQNSETLLVHCIKAIDSSAIGSDDLLLMGGGDWNDAMDKVGVYGKGETVFGSMFLYYVISKFLQYLPDRRKYVSLMGRLKNGIERSWDGEWYLRAITDDGERLGSSKSDFCRIDLITQSFAVLSGAAEKKRASLAMLSAARKLIDFDNKIIKLLTPPITDNRIGYIGEYPAGVRENGGQYTHGAIWYVIALLESGHDDFAYSLIKMLNPINHSLTSLDVKRYEVEPYVVSADVYAEPAGKGGWSWYTGAASWFYVALVKYLFGIEIGSNSVKVVPHLPSCIKNVKVKVSLPAASFVISIENGEGKKWKYYLGNTALSMERIPIKASLNGKEIIVRKV